MKTVLFTSLMMISSLGFAQNHHEKDFSKHSDMVHSCEKHSCHNEDCKMEKKFEKKMEKKTMKNHTHDMHKNMDGKNHMLMMHDTNKDGQVDQKEFTTSAQNHFDKMDKNKDGVISDKEI